MLLDIKTEVFTCADHLPVITLLGLLAECRHDWYPTMVEASRMDQFVEQLGKAELRVPALAEFAGKSLKEAANPRPSTEGAVPVTAKDLGQVVADLGREAVLVVEDAISDECFVLALAAAFGYHKIVKAKRRRWLRFAHAGGKSRMHLFVADEREPFTVHIRVAALLDSDRGSSTGDSPNKRQFEKIQAVPGVTEIHMWAWREVENYVPTRVWDEHYPHKGEAVVGIRTMKPVQRGFVDIKHKIGDRRGKSYKMPSPLIPDDLALTEADFAELGQDAVDELRAFLAMILRIL